MAYNFGYTDADDNSAKQVVHTCSPNCLTNLYTRGLADLVRKMPAMLR